MRLPSLLRTYEVYPRSHDSALIAAEPHMKSSEMKDSHNFIHGEYALIISEISPHDYLLRSWYYFARTDCSTDDRTRHLKFSMRTGASE